MNPTGESGGRVRRASCLMAIAMLCFAATDALVPSPAFPHAAGGSHASTPHAHAARKITPAVQLVETIPVETALGNPELIPTQAAWLQLIRASRHSLDIEQFYLSNHAGEPLAPVLDAIRAAARRGVRVRLLLDRRMHATYPQPADSLGQLPGIETRSIDFGALAGGVQHTKFMVADGEAVLLGSANFDWRSLKHVHELGVLIHDARVARAFAPVFDADWALALDPNSAAARAALSGSARIPDLPYALLEARGDTARVWPSYSPFGLIPDSTRWDRDAIVRLLDAAHSEIVVQSLTYASSDRRVYDDTLDRALRRAAGRGVRVRLVISDWEAGSDAMRDLIALSAVPGIEIRLSVLPEWSGGYVPFARVEHCKYAVVDSLSAWIGSSNWEPSYFHGSRNLAVTLENRGLAIAARRVFEASWRAAAANRVSPSSHFTARIHGETPPPGHLKYGD
jgi:phosphatidylserine/phosphatidylglycerophosphate/cardiolipin synthase-like enzyme